MNPEDLHSLIHSGQPRLLIDILHEEVHAAKHIPGSANACVYEMAFVDQVMNLAPEKSSLIIVYGAGEGSRDSSVALEKLKSAGYGNVMDFTGGTKSWKQAGFPVIGHGRLPKDPPADGLFRVDVAESIIRWTGRNLFNHHNGTVRISSGETLMSDSKMVSARFDIDLHSILCEDIADASMSALLIRHLQDTDFFQVAVRSSSHSLR